jgi:hypothetical protein
MVKHIIINPKKLGMSKEEKMLEYKKRIIEKEFRFINEVLNNSQPEGRETDLWSYVDKVIIKQCDNNLLERTGTKSEYNPHFDPMNYFIEGDLFFAVKGTEVISLPATGSSNDGSGEYLLVSGTVGEEILRTELQPDFVVNVKLAQKMDQGKFFAVCAITIFKMVKIDMNEFYEKKFLQAARELTNELRMN